MVTRIVNDWRLMLCVLLSLILSPKLLAGNDTVGVGTDAAAESIIQSLKQRVIVTGDFKQEKTLSGLAYTLKSSGQFIFWQKQGLYLKTEKPFFNAFTITQNQLITWQTDGAGSIAKEHQGIVQREVNKTLFAILSADIPLIESRFNVRWLIDGDNWHLTLTPKLAVMQESLKQVVIDGSGSAAKAQLHTVNLMAGNGDYTRIQFLNQSVVSKAEAISTEQAMRELSQDQCRWFSMDVTFCGPIH